MTETAEALDARLEAELPMYVEARRIHAKMILAGDDGTWGGETDPVRVMIAANAILAGELAAVRSGGWQPIETAPKDGTTVVLLCQLVQGLVPICARWDDSNETHAGEYGRFAWTPACEDGSLIAEKVPTPLDAPPLSPGGNGMRVARTALHAMAVATYLSVGASFSFVALDRTCLQSPDLLHTAPKFIVGTVFWPLFAGFRLGATLYDPTEYGMKPFCPRGVAK